MAAIAAQVDLLNLQTKPDPCRSRACRTVGHLEGVLLHDARDGGLTSRPDLKSDTENMRTVSGGAAVPTLNHRPDEARCGTLLDPLCVGLLYRTAALEEWTEASSKGTAGCV